MNQFIFLDIDGTIRDFDGFIPDSTVEAVKKTREKGNQVFVCTGRPYFQIESKILQMGFDGIVAGSGSYIEYKGKCIQHNCFTLPMQIDLCDYLIQHHYILEIHTYQNNYILKKDYHTFINVGKTILEKLGIEGREIVENLETVDTFLDVENIEKVLFFGNEIPVEELKRKWEKDLYIVPLSIPGYDNFGGEITPRNVNKAAAIKRILKEVSGDIDQVIAIGDSENDLEMIQLAHTGVAMGNAVQKLKDAADITTDNIRNNGIMNIFRQLNLL